MLTILKYILEELQNMPRFLKFPFRSLRLPTLDYGMLTYPEGTKQEQQCQV